MKENLPTTRVYEQLDQPSKHQIILEGRLIREGDLAACFRLLSQGVGLPQNESDELTVKFQSDPYLVVYESTAEIVETVFHRAENCLANFREDYELLHEVKILKI